MLNGVKVKHWSPVKRVPKTCDPYWNVTEWEDVEADEYGGLGRLSENEDGNTCK